MFSCILENVFLYSRKARKEGIPLTVETCHHYLNLNSETIPNNATQEY